MLNPLPGEYVARVSAGTKCTVNVRGRTDFTFLHGFSSDIPNSLKDTTAQPIKGTLLTNANLKKINKNSNLISITLSQKLQ